jgi:hypothetical protein
MFDTPSASRNSYLLMMRAVLRAAQEESLQLDMMQPNVFNATAKHQRNEDIFNEKKRHKIMALLDGSTAMNQYFCSTYNGKHTAKYSGAYRVVMDRIGLKGRAGGGGKLPKTFWPQVTATDRQRIAITDGGSSAEAASGLPQVTPQHDKGESKRKRLASASTDLPHRKRPAAAASGPPAFAPLKAPHRRQKPLPRDIGVIPLMTKTAYTSEIMPFSDWLRFIAVCRTAWFDMGPGRCCALRDRANSYWKVQQRVRWQQRLVIMQHGGLDFITSIMVIQSALRFWQKMQDGLPRQLLARTVATRTDVDVVEQTRAWALIYLGAAAAPEEESEQLKHVIISYGPAWQNKAILDDVHKCMDTLGIRRHT